MEKKIKLSIILPVYNGEKYLLQAVESIRKNTFRDYELILIDDGSTDSTPKLIKKINPDLHLTNPENFGHPYSRNIGSDHAKGEILYFTDVDVELYSDTLEKVYRHFKNNNTNCVIGLYSLPSVKNNLCTIYKNAWISFSYLDSANKVNWFFTAVGAIRKNVWKKSRNFQNYKLKTGGSDITFGFDLSEKGINIIMDNTLIVNHLKKYSFSFLLKNDFNRSFGYSSIAFKEKRILSKVHKRGFANISRSFITGCIFSLLILITFLLSCFNSRLSFIGIFLLICYITNNIKFYTFLKKHYNLKTVTKCAFVMFIDHLTCMAGVIRAFIKTNILIQEKK